MKYEWKKAEKKFYLPKNEPEIIKIPSFNFFMLEGRGNPNDSFFAEYVGVLYSLSYAIRMSGKSGNAPKNFFEYTVYPLEGIWDVSEAAKKLGAEKIDKNSLVFKLMIRQPAFVTKEFALRVIETIKKKKPTDLLDKVQFTGIEDGECVQMMHLGSYDDEPASIQKMEEYCTKNGKTRGSKTHREIYLSDPRKVDPKKMKTVLRFRVSQ
jgi:hypothetical protein